MWFKGISTIGIQTFGMSIRKACTVESLNSVPQNSGKSHNRGQNMNDQLFM